MSFFLPFALRAANTRRPFAVDILSRKPCLCLRLVFEGWYVLFILLQFLPLLFLDGKNTLFFFSTSHYGKIFLHSSIVLITRLFYPNPESIEKQAESDRDS